MKILFTGASSFTGFWFVKTLAGVGHDVVCPLTGELDRYSGERRRRIEALKPFCLFVASAPFGSEKFLRLVDAEACHLLCHHAADVTNYRSPDFEPLSALRHNTHNLRAVLAGMKERGGRAVVLTGSVFENDEGVGGELLYAASPYGLSKGLTFQFVRHYCHEAGIPLGKFVIPNPFGPFEEPRFTAFLMTSWKVGHPAEVKTPDYVRDNIHVDLLALAYVNFIEKTAATMEPLRKTNPSGYVESQGEFAQRVVREVRTRTGWACELRLAQQTDFSEPLGRTNSEPAAQRFSDWDEKRAWDEFTRFYSG